MKHMVNMTPPKEIYKAPITDPKEMEMYELSYKEFRIGLLKKFRHEVNYKNRQLGTSRVAQWLRIRLPMQGTRVRALVWEDPTCRGATRPVSHNY